MVSGKIPDKIIIVVYTGCPDAVPFINIRFPLGKQFRIPVPSFQEFQYGFTVLPEALACIMMKESAYSISVPHWP